MPTRIHHSRVAVVREHYASNLQDHRTPKGLLADMKDSAYRVKQRSQRENNAQKRSCGAGPVPRVSSLQTLPGLAESGLQGVLLRADDAY